MHAQWLRVAAGGVEDGPTLLRGEDFDHEVDDVARGTELAGIALAAEDAEPAKRLSPG